jgi:hypothetical protein
MPIYYKTTVFLKFSKQLTNKGEVIYTRTETVTATGKTITDSENAALIEAAILSCNSKERVEYVLQTMKIKSTRIF